MEQVERHVGWDDLQVGDVVQVLLEKRVVTYVGTNGIALDGGFGIWGVNIENVDRYTTLDDSEDTSE